MPDQPYRPANRMKGVMFKYIPLMITCRQFEDFVLAYLNDELTGKQKLVFELHLKICRECRDYLADYRRTMELSKRAFADPDQALPGNVPEDLVKAILAARGA